MFKGMPQMKKLLEVQKKVKKLQKELEAKTYESSADDKFKIVINGKYEVVEVNLQEGLDKQELEKLIKKTVSNVYQDCKKDFDKEMASVQKSMLGGFF